MRKPRFRHKDSLVSRHPQTLAGTATKVKADIERRQRIANIQVQMRYCSDEERREYEARLEELRNS